MSLLCWVAVAVVIVAIWALIKRYETRLVLIASGLFLAIVALQPMAALNAFAKSMTNASLVMAICSSMGFAFVSSYTKADRSLVHYMASPIRGLGIFLIPVCTAITFFVNIAIPSAAGCAAAVGSTLIPVMLRAGIKPAAAAAAVLAGTIGSYLSPGNAKVDESKLQKQDDDFKPSPILALVPLIPITILVVGNVWVPAIKMGVAQAMLIGAICALIIARANPQTFTKEFFNGTGKGYADVMGIIIAAGVFAAGLKSAGLIDAFVAALKESNEIARWGGSFGPFLMGIITGSGDAATLAFNETVTPHAKDFGMTIEGLGGLAFLAGAAGRTASPIAGVTILVSGIAMVSPLEVVKRTALPMLLAVIACALLMV